MVELPNPDVRAVQVMPLGEVLKIPEPPTATYSPLPNVTAVIIVLPNPDVLAVQVIPSGEVLNLPALPLTT